jgi:hypothetical protein
MEKLATVIRYNWLCGSHLDKVTRVARIYGFFFCLLFSLAIADFVIFTNMREVADMNSQYNEIRKQESLKRTQVFNLAMLEWCKKMKIDPKKVGLNDSTQGILRKKETTN